MSSGVGSGSSLRSHPDGSLVAVDSLTDQTTVVDGAALELDGIETAVDVLDRARRFGLRDRIPMAPSTARWLVGGKRPSGPRPVADWTCSPASDGGGSGIWTTSPARGDLGSRPGIDSTWGLASGRFRRR